MHRRNQLLSVRWRFEKKCWDPSIRTRVLQSTTWPRSIERPTISRQRDPCINMRFPSLRNRLNRITHTSQRHLAITPRCSRQQETTHKQRHYIDDPLPCVSELLEMKIPTPQKQSTIWRYCIGLPAICVAPLRFCVNLKAFKQTIEHAFCCPIPNNVGKHILKRRRGKSIKLFHCQSQHDLAKVSLSVWRVFLKSKEEFWIRASLGCRETS